MEHRILRFLGELAQERGLEFVAVSFVATAKNEPAHLFLEQIGPSFREEAGGSVVYRFPGAALRNLNVQEIVPTAPSRTTEPPRPAPTATESKRANSAHSTTERIKRIAETLYDSQQVLRSIESKNRPQRRLNTEPVWPRNEIEQELQRIWVAVLGIHDLGVTDPFFALGGNSLQMTQIMSRVEQELGLVISFPEFFEFPTIAGQASLAVLDEDDSAEAQPTAVDSTVKQVTGPVVREDTPRQSVMTPSAGRTQTTQAGQKPVGSGAAQITCLAVPTRDRLSSLQRCLQSYLTNFRAYQRTLEILVADDSRDAAKRANTRQFLQKFGREHDIGIRYAGADEKRQFARQLAEESGIPSHVVEFALFGTPDCDNFIGANRNAILLETAGEFILTADDDTLGETRRFPAPSGKLTFSGAADPAETWIFPDAIAAERSVIREPFNLLAGHEILLGKALPELVAESGGEYATAPYGRVDSLLESVQSQRGRIAIVQSGFLGDCAWGAPFGYWGVPMGSLLLRGAAHRQLVRTPEAYQAAIASRHVVRTFTAPTISESMYFLGCSASLDNRELLPPYFPVQRGEDLLLGAVLRSCLPDRFFGYIPGLFEHSPLEIRRFWPGEMFRTASGIDVARMVIELIRSEPRPVPCQTPEQRLQGLGEYLQEISRHPAREFGHYVRQAVQQGNRRLEAEMTECLAENEYRPEYWVNDVRHYLKLVREAQERPDYHVPVDLQRGRTAEMALELARRLVYQFGELLMAWPKLVAAAQRLKLEHHALAIRVH
ncbi:MAG: hypothetical protein JSS02_23540 [Planctomycetes bacterium]|nr:hypothetical protein [Planctomycetota bacterium]